MRFIVFLSLSLVLFVANSQALKIGILIDEPPFSIQVGKNNTFTGFESQLMTEVCKRLQATCSYTPVEFKNFFPLVFDHKLDLAIGQISITDIREKQFLFSLPYLIADGQYITQKNSGINEVSNLRGKKIGIYKNSLYKAYLLLKFNNDVEILEYDSSETAFQALNHDEVDALLLANISEKYWIANSNFDMHDFHFLGKPIPLGDGFGIMANLDEGDLIQEINQILLKMQADGTYERIYNLYFGLL